MYTPFRDGSPLLGDVLKEAWDSGGFGWIGKHRVLIRRAILEALAEGWDNVKDVAPAFFQRSVPLGFIRQDRYNAGNSIRTRCVALHVYVGLGWVQEKTCQWTVKRRPTQTMRRKTQKNNDTGVSMWVENWAGIQQTQDVEAMLV